MWKTFRSASVRSPERGDADDNNLPPRSEKSKSARDFHDFFTIRVTTILAKRFSPAFARFCEAIEMYAAFCEESKRGSAFGDKIRRVKLKRW